MKVLPFQLMKYALEESGSVMLSISAWFDCVESIWMRAEHPERHNIIKTIRHLFISCSENFIYLSLIKSLYAFQKFIEYIRKSLESSSIVVYFSKEY